MNTANAARLAKRKRKMITYGWILGLAALTVSLIYWEKTALLYILATLGVTVLLVVVAFADLAHAESMTEQPASPGPSETPRR